MGTLNQITTPFGRRPMTLGMLENQYESTQVAAGASVDKWKLFRALCEARSLFGISDRALAVLNALLTFYPQDELSEAHGLVVFPSNAQLSLRAHGIAPATLRRHIAALVNAGLLIRKDSPNGKRYVRRGRGGQTDEAFGFSVAALVARAAEIFSHAARIVADRALLRALRERLSICRRDIAKLIEFAVDQRVQGDWTMIHDAFRILVERVPRKPDINDVETTLEKMEFLRSEILIRLETRINDQKQSTNESQFERHIQNSETDLNTESERGFEAGPGKNAERERAIEREIDVQTGGYQPHSKETSEAASITSGGKLCIPMKSFPLGFVLQACPDIVAYGHLGRISSWRDLMTAAVVVRSMLGVSPSAYEDACEAMGPENAATVMACLLQRADHIKSVGGYLRDLTSRAERGEFAIGPMLMALMRSGSLPDRRAG
ncbi:MAG: replication initiation protein RepC [Rhizobiaceae bacterium]|nr:replication initiation protein RepC [Rhizobiaceae bacterium]